MRKVTLIGSSRGVIEVVVRLAALNLLFMMTCSRFLLLGLAILFSAPLCLRAQAPDDSGADLQQKINDLEKLVIHDEQQQVASTLPTPATSTNTPSTNAPPTLPLVETPPSRAVRYAQVLRQEALRHDYGNAIAAANNVAGADSSTAVQQAVAPILAELQKLKDALDNGVKQESQVLIDRVTKAITTAKEAKDLDAIILELGQAINESRSGMYTAERQASYQQLEGVSRFVKVWQSYLADEAAGNSMQAGNDLRNLSNASDTYMPIPRSQILALAQKFAAAGNGPTTQVIDAKVEVHSFDDLPGAINQLQTMQRNGGYNMDLSNLLNSLQGLQTAWLAYQDKNYIGALQQVQNYSPMVMGSMSAGVSSVDDSKAGTQSSLRQEIIALKDTLILDIAQGLLAMPDAPPADKDEHATDYLLRVAAAKSKAADWAGLQQVLTVYQQVASPYNPQAWLQEDMEGIRAYLVAEKLEGAGQDLDAIRSYRQSLATLGKFFPADPPADKLKELAKKYPDLYQQALQQPIAPKGP